MPTTLPTTLNDKAEHLLKRATLFKTLAQGFCYPNSGHRDTVLEAGSRLQEVNHATSPSRKLTRDLRTLLHVWEHASDSQLATEYLRLFLGSAPCSLHETAYGDGRRIAGRPVELADISGFYLAFGFELTEVQPDLPDQLAVELEFYSLMLLKQAYTLFSRRLPAYQIVKQGTVSFLNQHLGRWVGTFTRKLQESQAPLAYQTLASLLLNSIEVECRYWHIQPVLVEGRLPPDLIQEDNLSCPKDQTPIH